MAKMNSENRAYWKQIIQEQQASGLSVPKFCLQKDLKTYKFSYFKAILFPKKQKKSSFVKVVQKEEPPTKEPPRILIYFKDISLSFEGGHDAQLLADLCLALGKAE